MTLEKVRCTTKAHTTRARDDRRRFLATVAATGAFGLTLLVAPSYAQTVPAADAKASLMSPLSAKLGAADAYDSIRPLRINVPEADLVDLRQRVVATRWPDKETVTDQSQGVQLAKIQELVRYWGTDYDWRKAEAKLNALPEFVTTIDGLDIQFVWVRSRHSNAMPLIMTHGWPGSIFELLKVIGPLTDPTAYGGRLRSRSAFDARLWLLGQTAGHWLES